MLDFARENKQPVLSAKTSPGTIDQMNALNLYESAKMKVVYQMIVGRSAISFAG